MGKGFAEKKDTLATKSPNDNFDFQLFRLPIFVCKGSQGKYRNHLFLNP